MPGLRRIYGGQSELQTLRSINTAERNMEMVRRYKEPPRPLQMPGQYVSSAQNAISTTILPAGIIQTPINQAGGRKVRRKKGRRRKVRM